MHLVGRALVGGVVGVGGGEAERALGGERLDPLDHEPGAVPQHEELAGGRHAARGVDDDAVALAELGLHGVPAHLLALIGLAPVASAFQREVEAFLGATGTKGYVLGELALGDLSFVDRLRRGASFRLSTVERARASMARRCSARREQAHHREGAT